MKGEAERSLSLTVLCQGEREMRLQRRGIDSPLGGLGWGFHRTSTPRLETLLISAYITLS